MDLKGPRRSRSRPQKLLQPILWEEGGDSVRVFGVRV